MIRTIDLNGAWTARDGADGNEIPATIPGCVHLDLLAAGRIPDPFFRDNENIVQWVSEREWIYWREFEVSAELLKEKNLFLRCEGLDTLASLELNGKEVGAAENMFRTWEFDVKRLLRPGTNRLEIRFKPALPYTRARMEERYIHAWQSREDGVNYIRKEPCNYGWDWGPKLITCGIWRPIFIEAWSGPRLGDVAVSQNHRTDDGSVELNIDAPIRKPRRASGNYHLAATIGRVGEITPDDAVTVPCNPATGADRLALHISSPRLWWPRGLGEQPLYRLRVELHDDEGRALDVWEKRIGLRTLRLERTADEWGESFQFVANGVPFFAKGSNWIPADAFASRVTNERYRQLLHSAAAANMNMIRVWGGGIYEQEIFYDLCDELGICVWQDFMFACACYPTFDKAFMKNVKAEAEDQVRRLRHRACLALWCGNNELEQGLCGPKWTEHQMPWKEYAKLFDRLLPDVVRTLDPGRDYWPGSPHTPRKDRVNCNAPDAGDAHLWYVWHRREPFEWYRTAFHRFVSEFGFQSFPEPKTIQAFALPEDNNISSHVMDFHQRSFVGNGVIMSYLLDWFRQPKDFESLVWLSQILHGLAMRYAVEHWRRQMPRCMGALYWQLNDTWPGPSWSSIDYFGRWKALHFMARRFFAPLLVSFVERPGERLVEAWVTSDLREEAKATLRLIATDCEGRELLKAEENIRIPPQASRLVVDFSVDAIAEPGDWGRPSTHPLMSEGGVNMENVPAPRDLIIWAELEIERCDGTREIISRNTAAFSKPKHLKLQNPEISAEISETDGNEYAVTLTVRHPAFYVWMELEGADAEFSDNFVDVRPGVPVEVSIRPNAPVTAHALKSALKVRSAYCTSQSRRH